MPLAVIEAMMAGLPIVATSVGDLPEMLKDDRGALVPPSQPEKLAKEAAFLLANVDKMKLMGFHAQEYAKQNYSSSAWINKLSALYNEVIQ
jgi:glycosyltransferase involved in cell wall biosynthesis